MVQAQYCSERSDLRDSTLVRFLVPIQLMIEGTTSIRLSGLFNHTPLKNKL